MKKILGLVFGLLFTLPAFATDLDPCRNLFDENSFYNAVGPSYEIFPTSNENGRTYFLRVKPNTKYTISFKTPGDRLAVYSLNKEVDPRDYSTAHPLELGPTLYNNNAPTSPTVFTTREDSKMVAIYYSLSERPTEFQIEEGSTATAYEPYNAACWAIKVATKKYNDTAFSPVVTALNSAISTIKSVVTNTINQAAAVQSLQTGKQTMPNASATNGTCPNYKQCLLVETSDGTPQWFVITDPFRDFVTPILATNTNGTSSANNPGYQQVEYIESDGTQYIDTGVVPNANTRVQVKYMLQENASEYPMIFGARTSGQQYSFYGIRNQNEGKVYYSYGYTDNIIIPSAGSYNIVYEADCNAGTQFTLGSQSINVSGTLSNISSTIFLFARNEGNNTSGYRSKAKMYYLKIHEDGSLVRNFVPVIRNSDSAIGMYDKVNNTFYANVGSGTFTAGPIVDNDPGVPGMIWSVTWSNNGDNVAGTVYGVGKCSETSYTVTTPTSDSGWNNNGVYCWCRMTEISVGGQTYTTDKYKWTHASTNISSAACARECSRDCVGGMGYQYFRASIFNTGS